MARILRPTRVIRHLEYLKPMKLYELARDTDKNMIGCDLGEAISGVVLHLYGSNKVFPFRSLHPSMEPFTILRFDQMNPNYVTAQLYYLVSVSSIELRIHHSFN